MNVAPDPNMDTLGYLHINNPNSRYFIERMKALSMLTDVFRHKNPELRKYTFSKGQAKNHTKARLYYFLMNSVNKTPKSIYPRQIHSGMHKEHI